MIKEFSAEKNIEFLKVCMELEKSMTETLNKWSSDIDIDAILDEYPYLEPNSALLTVLADSLIKSFDFGDEFIKFTDSVFEKNTSTNHVFIKLYFISPQLITFKKIISSGIEVDDNILMEFKGNYEKTLLILRHYIMQTFNFKDYPNGDCKRIYESYESQYGSIENDVKRINNYCSDHKVFYNSDINDNYDLFINLLEKNPMVDQDEFVAYSEAVMPWDVELLKSGELQFDENYLDRLKKRVNEVSIYNDVPIIRDVIDKLPRNRYMDMYHYENVIDFGSIEMIKDGKLTFDRVLDDCVKNVPTDLFN